MPHPPKADDTAIELPIRPYRGNGPLEYVDRHTFAGREGEAGAILGRLTRERCIILTGNPGVGKSSLVNAGVMPAARAAGHFVERLRFEPTVGPHIVVERIPGDDEGGQLYSALRASADVDGRLELEAADGWLARTDSVHPVWIVDRFEELLSWREEEDVAKREIGAASEATIAAWLVTLLSDPARRVSVLFVVREAYVGRVLSLLSDVRDLPSRVFRLEPIAADRIERVIGAPFDSVEKRAHFKQTLSKDVISKVAQQLGSRGGGLVDLTELQIVCLALWNSSDPAKLLERKRVSGLIQEYANRRVVVGDETERGRRVLMHVSAWLVVLLGATINLVDAGRVSSTPSRAALVIDFGVIIAYTTFFFTASAVARIRRAFRDHMLGVAIIAVAVVAGFADVLENASLLRNAGAAPSAGALVTIKWTFFFAAGLLTGLLMISRSGVAGVGAFFMALGAVLGFVGVFAGPQGFLLLGAALVGVSSVAIAFERRLDDQSRSSASRARAKPEHARNFEDQLASEAESIAAARRRSVTGLEPDAKEIEAGAAFGIALSGGGIRSATFNLGLLQALDDLGVLGLFDYLATVSGGGYAGGFWSGCRKRSLNRFPRAAHNSVKEAREIRHLREFSNFLSPRLGLLSYDVGRMVVAGVSAFVPAIATALSVVLLAFSVWLLLAWVMLAPWDGGRISVSTSSLILGIVPATVLIFMETKWRQRGERASNAYGAATIVAVSAAAAAWAWWLSSRQVPSLYVEAHGFVALITSTQPASVWWTLFLPALMWLAGALLLVVVRWIASRWAHTTTVKKLRNGFDRVTSRLFLCAVAWAVFSALWVIGAAAWHMLAGNTTTGLAGLAGTAAALGLALRGVQRAFSEQPNKPFGSRFAAIIKPKLPQIIAYATITVMAVAVVVTLIWIATPDSSRDPSIQESLVRTKTWWAMAVAAGICLLTLGFFNPNETGLHSFYRARIARAFLGASNADSGRETEESAKDDFALNEMSPLRPLHLVCCAANDLASNDHLANLHRGAVSSVLSRLGFSVDEDWRPWATSEPVPTLGSAITASGAAFNSHMGSKSMELGDAVTFVMTAFNLRLGMWLPHPRRYDSFAQFFVGYSFFAELFGQSRANGYRVHLSDGGHFENMALYELIRRGCRFILASDCGADPDVGFDDLGNLVRRVREDFNVEIDIDVSPLRKGEGERSRQPMVAGDIHYPNGNVGVLLLVKPTIVGNEPIDIHQYRSRNPAFPHESTGDQFYDEAQWESYRRLGVHAGMSAMKRVIDALNDELPQSETSDPKRGARLFARARMLWQPSPAGAEARLPAIASRIGELDRLLQSTDCKRLMPQVYREIDDLDRESRKTPRKRENGFQWLLQGLSPKPAETRPVLLPPPEELAPSLHLMRSAILFMEEVFVSEELERHYNHPMYLGLINYFARWAYAPIFRMWWPLLRSLHSRRFTGFMERMYDLESVTRKGDKLEGVDVAVNTTQRGFASHCWHLDRRRGRRAHDDEIMASFYMCVRYRDSETSPEQRPYTIEGAVARLRPVPLNDSTGVVWTSDDFYVPPGLWGMGVGERFLDLLVSRAGKLFTERKSLADATTFIVAIRRPVQSRGAVRKEGADLTSMYRAAGFAEASLADMRGTFGSRAIQIVEKVPDDGDPQRVILQDVESETAYRWMHFTPSGVGNGSPRGNGTLSKAAAQPAVKQF